ncbi:peptidoglycan editing factor PgeF [Alicyclobacillus mali]|uniref:Purine nucleoside phosphorylase n=1 Tax=Alicyclobacillus mali (ex Roth et al. 2021) TaxID=1123961 RepID=A0ABS0F2R6_9BACL|nr:peptidoglycan editing factor PgeF [Alicyclobacillus mali (ex Roth et al. 2021)]MBF8377583.1 peptidoglycan editing factor PgeF [Alicyclobacillus mali (ex Roth et al. 2021)]MCL6488799.1 peptidoglycan editing factor PgeF [Alicyclobacillus mali (ex Roth et al. 2021)]
MRLLKDVIGQHGGLGIRPPFADPGVRAMFFFRHLDVFPPADADVSPRLAGPEVAREHRGQMLGKVGLRVDSLCLVRQVHGPRVVRVDAPTESAVEADGMITDVPGLALAVLVADCAPVLLYDPVRRVVGACHSGWRGTVEHIVARGIERMRDEYGTDPGHLRVAIGPCIRRCCYEVDDVVAERARNARLERALLPRFGRPDKYVFSLPHAIRLSVEACGVQPEHIYDSGVCTSCRNRHLFSHRREGERAGRQMAVIALGMGD